MYVNVFESHGDMVHDNRVLHAMSSRTYPPYLIIPTVASTRTAQNVARIEKEKKLVENNSEMETTTNTWGQGCAGMAYLDIIMTLRRRLNVKPNKETLDAINPWQIIPFAWSYIPCFIMRCERNVQEL